MLGPARTSAAARSPRWPRSAARPTATHAVAQVVVQQQHRDPAQGGVDRRDLGEDVDAVGVLVDQPLQAADLALNPAQAGLQLVLVRRIAPHPQPLSYALPP